MTEPPDAASQAPPSMLRIAAAWLPALAYMTLIWWLSSIPITLPLPYIPWRDKAVHVVEYGVLGLLNAQAVRGTRPALRMRVVLVVAALITCVWGYLDEVHQAFVPGRDASAFDLLADAVGALLGMAAYAAIATVLRRRAAAK